MSTEKFVYVTYIASTPKKVWSALIEGELTRQYWKHEQVTDWKTGSDWSLVADDQERTVKCIGKVLETVPEKRLVVTWGDPGDAADATRHSRLAIDLEPVGDTVRLTVTHENLSPDLGRRISNGWPVVLASLKSFLETGRPLDVFGCSAPRA